jgi:hypothetical protein
MAHIMLPRKQHKTARIKSTFIVVPNVEITVHEGDGGRILRRVRTNNLITDSGLDHMRNLIAYPDADISTGFTPMYIAVGSGGVAAAAGDTTLGNEIFRGEITQRYPQTHGIEFHLFLTTAQGNGAELTEAGIFHIDTGGTLWSRCTYAAISKSVAISVNYRWTWTFGTP